MAKTSSVKILIITTSHKQLGATGRNTGVWLEELASPYYIFKEAGAEITLASPLGGVIPMDDKSESIIASTPTIRRFQKDLEVISSLAHSLPLDTLKAADFDMVFLPGGYGSLWDLPNSKSLAKLLEDFHRQGKVIGLVSHGVCALLSMKTSTNQAFVKGVDVTCFSSSEEERSGLKGVIPLLLESKLAELGAYYSRSEDFTAWSVVSGHIVSGQNTASCAPVAKKMLALLKDVSTSRPAPQPY